MSGSIIPTPDYKAADGQSFGTQVEKARLGFIALSLTEYDTATVPQIAAGSCVEISGSIFQFSSNDTITGTPNSGYINYIMLTVSGSGDSQEVEASWTTTAPSWNTSKQGWYDATNAKRYVAECYYDGTNYRSKQDYGGSYKTRGDGIPEGVIVAQIPGYFGNGSNGSYVAVSIPLISKWKECNGAALNDPLSIIFNGAGRYLPNLTDDRFLMGNTVVGEIGGSSTVDHTHNQGSLVAHITLIEGNDSIYSKEVSCTEWEANFVSLTTNITSSTSDRVTGADVVGSTGPSTNTENRPKYLACKYIIKVRA